MTDEKDLFKEENIPESNWWKFEKIGEKVWGIVVGIEEKAGQGDYPDQIVWTLKQEDGSFIKVGISVTKDYVIGRANSAKFGDILGFHYKKDIPASVKGHQPAKSIEVYVKQVKEEDKSDENIAKEASRAFDKS